jgi:hypothetical protein
MQNRIVTWQLLAACALAAATVACSDSPAEPRDDVNPALVEAAGQSSGFGGSVGAGLPQGAAAFTGPGGMPMDATAEEFIQQLTLKNGKVLKTSGIMVTAVPDESVTGSPFASIRFGAAHIGSLASVRPGVYATVAELPLINFIDEHLFGLAQLRIAGSLLSTLASPGQVTIQPVEYFRDVFTCTTRFSNSPYTVDKCEYQLGVVRGTIEFRGSINDTEVVQQRTPFTLPIMRRTILLSEN